MIVVYELASCCLINSYLLSFTCSDITGDHTKVHRLTISDFGKSIDLGMFPPNVTFIGRSNTDKFECIEMTKGLPWKYQVSPHSTLEIPL